MADEATKQVKVMSVADRDNLFASDDDDDLFVDAEEAPIAPPRSKKESGAAAAAGPRSALPSAGVDLILTSIPQLTARNLVQESSAMVCELCNMFLTAQAMQHMNDSGTVFMLRSSVGSNLTPIEKQFIDAIINLSAFKDELKENNSPKVDINESNFAASITAVMVKTQYLVKGWRAENFSPEFIASYDYQSGCQPGKPSHVPNMPSCALRFTKTIIPVVYKVTIQFQTSEITDVAELAALEAMVGVRIDKAILLERTKRRIEIVDATLKCKSGKEQFSYFWIFAILDGNWVPKLASLTLCHCLVPLSIHVDLLCALSFFLFSFFLLFFFNFLPLCCTPQMSFLLLSSPYFTCRMAVITVLL